MIISKIMILNIFIFAYSAETYDCRNGTVNLKLNEIAFFETQNYPFYLTADEQDQCDLMFVLKKIDNKRAKMILAFYQFPVTLFHFDGFPTVFSASDNSSYSIKSDFSPYNDPIAEQGFVAFFDDFDSCPLEFLCKNKPFEILNENRILYIKSSYYNNQVRNNSCHWRFVAPAGYGFKIVVQKFNISKTTSFKIENQTDIIVNERSVKTNYPYYNSFIRITLTKGDPNFITDIEFQAYISIIKSSQEKTNSTCNVIFKNNSITWSNNNEVKGYENSQQCFYELILPPKAFVVVTMSGFLEDNIDFVKYQEVQSNNSEIFDYNKYEFGFIMDNFKGNSDKHFLWEFESDGSVQYWGFSVIFEFFVCECSLKVAKCESYNNHLMDVYGSVDSSYYCGNLNCNIPIEKCSSPLTLIEFFTMEYVSKNDEFQIISNNRTTFEIVDWNYDTHVAYLNSSSENVFQVITHSSSNINTLYFHVEEFYVPPELKIHLSENQSSVIIDTAINNFTNFEISSEIKNRFFIIYCPNPNLIGLYTDTSLKTPIKYWTKMPLTGRKTVACNKCILERDKFVAYSSSYTETTYLAVRLPLRAGNCAFEETIFNTNQRTSLTITSLSNKNGSCLISILVDGLYRIKHLWTTSRTQNVKMFVGIDQKKLFLEFNSNTAEIWENTALWSTVYTILMPDSTAIFVRLELQDYQKIIKISTYPYKTLISSPYYGCSKSFYDLNDGSFVQYYITNYPVIFTVLDFDLALYDIFFFETADERIYINKTGEYVIFHNQNVSLFYSTNIGTSNGAIISVGNVGEKVSKTNDDEKREVEILEAEQACVEAKNDENGVLIAGDIKYDHVRRGTEETFKKFKEFLRDLEKSRQDQINSMPLDDLNAAEKELSDNLFELINAHDCVQEESKACFESVIEIQEKTLKIDEGKAAAIWFMPKKKILFH